MRRCTDGDGTSPFKIVVFVRRGLLLTLLQSGIGTQRLHLGTLIDSPSVYQAYAGVDDLISYLVHAISIVGQQVHQVPAMLAAEEGKG